MAAVVVDKEQVPRDVPPAVVDTINKPTDASNTGQVVQGGANTDDSSGSSILRYVFIGVLTVALIILLYYAYNRFVANTLEEPMTKGVEQERDDPVVDFNLREAIKNLQGIQKRVLSTLSETMNI